MIQIEENSWHRVFANRGGMKHRRRTNLCMYLWAVMWGILITTAFYAAAGFMIFALYDLTLALWFWTHPQFPGAIILVGTLLAAIFICCLIALVHDLIEKISEKANRVSLIAEARKAYKDKFCPYVELK
jgi:hypothetical protein